MNMPSEFALHHYGKEIAMLADCILDLITKLLISYMVILRDIQKHSIASHLKGLNSSFQLCCQVPTSHAYTCRKVDKMNARFSLALEANQDVLVPPYRFQSRESSCCMGNPGKFLRFGCFIRDDRSQIFGAFHLF